MVLYFLVHSIERLQHEELVDSNKQLQIYALTTSLLDTEIRSVLSNQSLLTSSYYPHIARLVLLCVVYLTDPSRTSFGSIARVLSLVPISSYLLSEEVDRCKHWLANVFDETGEKRIAWIEQILDRAVAAKSAFWNDEESSSIMQSMRIIIFLSAKSRNQFLQLLDSIIKKIKQEDSLDPDIALYALAVAFSHQQGENVPESILSMLEHNLEQHMLYIDSQVAKMASACHFNNPQEFLSSFSCQTLKEWLAKAKIYALYVRLDINKSIVDQYCRKWLLRGYDYLRSEKDKIHAGLPQSFNLAHQILLFRVIHSFWVMQESTFKSTVTTNVGWYIDLLRTVLHLQLPTRKANSDASEEVQGSAHDVPLSVLISEHSEAKWECAEAIVSSLLISGHLR